MTRLGTEDPAGSRGAGEAACGAAGSLAVAVRMPASLRLVMGAGSGKLKPVSDTRARTLAETALTPAQQALRCGWRAQPPHPQRHSVSLSCRQRPLGEWTDLVFGVE